MLDVEDGTGRATAESYASVAEADTYFTARGSTVWPAALTTAQKEQALRKAADYLVQVYRSRWKGYRSTATQALDWPRQSVPIEDSPPWSFYYPTVFVGPTVIPQELKNAQFEVAVRAVAGELAPDISPTVKRSRVGEIEVEYADDAANWTIFRVVDNILVPFLKSSGANARLLRT